MGFLTRGRQSQGLQDSHLDAAAHPALGQREMVQPLQQRERLVRGLLGDAQPDQDQGLALVGIVGLALAGEAARGDPVGDSGELALSEQQPHPLHRGREDQVGDQLLAGQDPLGLPMASRAPGWSPHACRIQASAARLVTCHWA